MANKTNSKISIVMSILLLLTLCTSTMGKTIYVDDDADGANDGSSWENAYVYLQDALADANPAEKPVEIRVAQGSYKPDQGAGQTPGDREATFQLVNDVNLAGGYAGLGAEDPNARDIELYKTILSGDLDGDDADIPDAASLLGHVTRVENSYHVLTARDIDLNATLDGFTIIAGNANDEESVKFGGGILYTNGYLKILNCNFQYNTATIDGGAIYNRRYLGELIITNCKFFRNASEDGGAICDLDCTILTDCRFTENYAISSGGAVDAYRGNPILTNCIFEYNSSYYGGGMHNISNSEPTLINCMFIGNYAEGFGGGFYNLKVGPPDPNTLQLFDSCTFKDNHAGIYGGGLYNAPSTKPLIQNCLFVNNSSSNWGGALHFWQSNAEVINCTITNNFAQRGGAISCGYENTITSSNIKLTNCILWNNSEEIYKYDDSQITITYSCIQYLKPGRFGLSAGNINQDPCFVDPGKWVNANGTNSIWIDGDYHLKSQAGRWDPNSQSWVKDDVTSPCIDAGDPNSPVGDEPFPNGGIINMGAYGGTAEASMSLSDAGKVIYIQWLGHSSVKVWAGDVVIYIDPRNLSTSPQDATAVLVTHSHGDHYQRADIDRVSGPETIFFAPADVVALYGKGQTILPGQTIQFDDVNVIGVPAYNSNHPKANNWVGYIIEIASKRIYIAGDTDVIEEMKSLGHIDVAFLPAGGTYTMNAQQAAEATNYIKPLLAIPYHWGQIVGTISDAQRFASFATCNVKIMSAGEIISSDDWLKDFSLIAYWKLDETAGLVAHDSAGDKHGTLNGNPIWQPDGGKIDGALRFDGDGDYISAPFVRNPADGKLSVYAWIKGGTPGQVIISQTGGENWLLADPSAGNLMTELKGTGRNIRTLTSQTIVTDNDWHRVGLVWDGSNRVLYVDDAEVAGDTQGNLAGSNGGLNIGAGKNLEPGSFWAGLIDDVRIHNRAVSP